jgi:hypothetical protein
MSDLERFWLFGNMTWGRGEDYMQLGKRHVSRDGKTSLCGRVPVTDTAWISPLYNAEFVSCKYCAHQIAGIINAQPQLALAVGE